MIFDKFSVKYAYFLSALVVAVDQLTKHYFSGTSLVVKNTGAAFGILKGSTSLLIIISLIVLFFIIRYFKFYPLALSLLLGGTIGNLIDRIRLGYVVDFIDLKFWPVFNIADSANTVGFILLIWMIIKKK